MHGGEKYTHTRARDVTGVIPAKNSLYTDQEVSGGFSLMLVFLYSTSYLLENGLVLRLQMYWKWC